MFLTYLWERPTFYFLTVAIVVASVTLHECAHALAATYEGDDTPKNAGHLTLNPIVHLGKASLVFLLLFGICWGLTPVNPSKFRHRYGDALVSLAGPVTNLLLMVLGLVAMLTLSTGQAIFERIAILNAALFLLNMIPLPPLDGYAALGNIIPAYKHWVEGLGQASTGLLLLFFFFGGSYLYQGAAFLAGMVYGLLMLL